ncbi:transcriptional corepressor LEUNIG_HOMOLOG-like [Hibiscus syriacus]|uniref:transcriptional corepressor LEUNIG_HOMOLOG-like n=1 Tax=Hibiscus syriacus TaxID=106335 RepID=UPI00192181E8|nr:transcriptional corepressor LEUNIG_HOMOLOG-like [Hibiscus syriacus]
MNQMPIQTVQTEEHQNQYSLLQQLQTGRKKKKLSNSTTADQKLDFIKAEEHKPIDDTVDSFLSHDDDSVDNTNTPFKILKRRSNRPNKTEHKGFTFGEVSCLHSFKSKVLSCHFSSDGKFLASAGHEKKVLIWNMETLDFVKTSEDHSLLITDVRFRPCSTIFATSSFDKTVQIWDSAKPSKSLFKLVGHAEQVLSLDFHPGKVDLLCSCDSNNEMRLWNINQRACIHVSKAATKQVRFQPRLGMLLATASGNVVNVIDVETNKPQSCLKGHNKEVLSICWDPCGKYIASISEDSARVWSVSGGECLHELRSTGNKFQSCTFHPAYSQFLVIGGYQCLELWNPNESNKTLAIDAHRGLILHWQIVYTLK